MLRAALNKDMDKSLKAEVVIETEIRAVAVMMKMTMNIQRLMKMILMEVSLIRASTPSKTPWPMTRDNISRKANKGLKNNSRNSEEYKELLQAIINKIITITDRIINNHHPVSF